MFLVGSYSNKEAVSLIAKLRFFGLLNVIYNIKSGYTIFLWEICTFEVNGLHFLSWKSRRLISFQKANLNNKIRKFCHVKFIPNGNGKDVNANFGKIWIFLWEKSGWVSWIAFQYVWSQKSVISVHMCQKNSKN